MQKSFIVGCLAFLGATTTFAQNTPPSDLPLEIGIQAGTSHFLGDLGGVGGPRITRNIYTGVSTSQRGIGQGFIIDTDIETTRFTFGIFGRYRLDEGAHFAARLDLNYLQVAGDDRYAGLAADNFSPTQSRDAITSAAWFRYYRNLNFRSDVFDANVSLEFTPYNFALGGNDYSILSPYGFIGIGLFAFNPQGYYEDEAVWVDLKPLRTEGQGIVSGRAPYDLVQMNIPMGFGAKWTYNQTWSIGLEVNYRLTFTDYIDDVSTDYVFDESVFADNMDPGTAALALAMARGSDELDPAGVNAVVTAPGEQRGNPKDNDAYYTVTLRVSYYLDTRGGGNSSRYGCPVW